MKLSLCCAVFLYQLLKLVPPFQAELLDPAVKGTLNVLNSCAKSPSVKRVVLTSSIAAVAFNGKPRTPDVIVDETWFSNPDLCREVQVCVRYSSLLSFQTWKWWCGLNCHDA